MEADPYPRWRYYPQWRQPPSWVIELAEAIGALKEVVSSRAQHLKSNQALGVIHGALIQQGFQVEAEGRLPRPVLFGDEGSVIKSFNVDAFHPGLGIALELESGGAMYNNRVLLDLMKMCLAVDVQFGVIAVPLDYTTGKKTWQPPFSDAIKLFDSIYANPERFAVPLEGLLILGY